MRTAKNGFCGSNCDIGMVTKKTRKGVDWRVRVWIRREVARSEGLTKKRHVIVMTRAREEVDCRV